jgi:hypothetical protein
MHNLLKSEFYKLKNTKTFFICLAVCAAFALIMAYATQHGVSDEKIHPNKTDLKPFLAMKPVLGGAWYIGQSLKNSIHLLFSGIFVSIFLSYVLIQ